MMNNRKFILPVVLTIALLHLNGADLSSEAQKFIALRPGNAQHAMIAAVNRAIDGNYASLNQIRQAMNQDYPPPPGISVREASSAGCRLRFYYPASNRNAAVLLYMHGGGWTVGGIEGSSRFCGEFAAKAGIDVAVLDYRLAPEHHAPAALEDTLNAIKFLRKNGYARIYLGGDSAGGNLAASAALKLGSELSGIVLFYPVVAAVADDSASWRKYGNGFGLDSALMQAFNDSYAPGVLAKSVDVSPLYADDFADYPPTLLIAAECDILFDQGKQFIAQLNANGVPARHVCISGALHAFMTYPGMDESYNKGMTEALNFITGEETKLMYTITDESIVRISRITVKPECLNDYLAMVTECGRTSMAVEPGVILMFSMQARANPELITILEIYRDRASYEKHIASEHFKKYKSGTLDMINRLELLDQTPLIPEMRMK